MTYQRSNPVLTANQKVFSGQNDPSVSAVDAPRGSLFLKLSAPIGVYQKSDDGLSTNWSPVGGGGGGGSQTVPFPTSSITVSDVGKMAMFDWSNQEAIVSEYNPLTSNLFNFTTSINAPSNDYRLGTISPNDGNDIDFLSIPNSGDTLVMNIPTGPSLSFEWGADIAIGATIEECVDNLVAFLNDASNIMDGLYGADFEPFELPSSVGFYGLRAIKKSASSFEVLAYLGSASDYAGNPTGNFNQTGGYLDLSSNQWEAYGPGSSAIYIKNGTTTLSTMCALAGVNTIQRADLAPVGPKQDRVVERTVIYNTEQNLFGAKLNALLNSIAPGLYFIDQSGSDIESQALVFNGNAFDTLEYESYSDAWLDGSGASFQTPPFPILAQLGRIESVDGGVVQISNETVQQLVAGENIQAGLPVTANEDGEVILLNNTNLPGMGITFSPSWFGVSLESVNSGDLVRVLRVSNMRAVSLPDSTFEPNVNQNDNNGGNNGAFVAGRVIPPGN